MPQLADELRDRGFRVRLIGWLEPTDRVPYMRRVVVERDPDPHREPISVSVPTMRFLRDVATAPESVVIHRDLGPVAAVVGAATWRRPDVQTLALLEHSLDPAGPAATTWWKQPPRRLCAHLPDRVLANHPAAAAQAAELGVSGNKVSVGWWMAGLGAVAPAPPSRPPSPIRLVTLGKLIPRKGIDLAIEAVGDAIRRGSDLTLTVIGEGPERDRLRALACQEGIADRVEFSGMVRHNELASALMWHDVLVFPSREDHTGRGAIEAMSVGLPVIASSHSGAADILVTDDQNGRIVDPLNRPAFAQLLNDLCPQSIQRWRTGAAGLADQLSIASCADSVEAALAQLRLNPRAGDR